MYTSSGPSIAQVLLANGAGGSFVAARSRSARSVTLPHSFSKGEIIEIKIKNPAAVRRELIELVRALHARHLDPVPGGQARRLLGARRSSEIPGHRPAGRVARPQRPALLDERDVAAGGPAGAADGGPSPWKVPLRVARCRWPR